MALLLGHMRDLLIKTQLDSATSSQKAQQDTFKNKLFDFSFSFEHRVAVSHHKKKKILLCVVPYQSNVFYLHTGLDKSEFGECTHAYRKP